MQIAKVLAVEAEEGTVVELSLKELQDGDHRLSDITCKDLLEEYQLFPCRATRRETNLARLQDLNAPSTTLEAFSLP
jgi:hypothetical protein